MFVSGLDFQMSFKIVQSQFPWVLQAADVRLLSSAQNHIHTYTYNNFAAGFFFRINKNGKLHIHMQLSPIYVSMFQDGFS